MHNFDINNLDTEFNSKQMNDFKDEVTAIQDLDERYDHFLDDVYETVNIAGHEYCTSKALEEIDPTAYRCGFDDWLDSECQNNAMVEIDGDHYDYDEVETFLNDVEEVDEDDVDV